MSRVASLQSERFQCGGSFFLYLLPESDSVGMASMLKVTPSAITPFTFRRDFFVGYRTILRDRGEEKVFTVYFF